MAIRTRGPQAHRRSLLGAIVVLGLFAEGVGLFLGAAEDVAHRAMAQAVGKLASEHGLRAGRGQPVQEKHVL